MRGALFTALAPLVLLAMGEDTGATAPLVPMEQEPVRIRRPAETAISAPIALGISAASRLEPPAVYRQEPLLAEPTWPAPPRHSPGTAQRRRRQARRRGR